MDRQNLQNHIVLFFSIYLVFMLQGLTHPVKIVQPIGPLNSGEDTACLRSLVSYVMDIQTENQITIVSK